MKPKIRAKDAAGNLGAAATAAKRSDQLSEDLEELHESSRRTLADLAQAGVTRDKIVGAVLAAEDGRNLELARMLHDSVGQRVAVLLLGLRGLEQDCGSGNARLTVQSLSAITESIGHELHKIAMELRPTSLHDHGLARSLTTFLEEWAVISKIAVDFDPVALGPERMPRDIEITLFRVVSDALQSVLGAPGASHVSVILKREHGVVTAIIEDLGTRQVAARELDASGAGGRANVCGRVTLMGGKLTVERRAGGGATVFARLPLPNAASKP